MLRSPAVGLLALGLAAGCTNPEPSTHADAVAIQISAASEQQLPEVLSRITIRDLRFAAARLRFERDESLFATPLSKELSKHVVDTTIEQRLLSLEAAEMGVKASTTAVQLELDRIRADHGAREFESVLMRTYQRESDLEAAIAHRLEATEVMRRQVFGQVKVDDKDLKRLWLARPDREKVEPEKIHASQILVRTEEDGKRAQRALAKKEAFADVARAKSIGPEAVRGGDLGWFARGDMPKVFDEACFHLEPGKISALTPSEFGYHLCLVKERKPERPLSFEEAREDLMRQARQEAESDAEQAYRKALHEQYVVQRNEEAIASAFSP